MSAIKMPSNISIGSLGASGALGFCTGAAIKASVTVLAALIGMNFLVIQLLRSQGIVTVDNGKLNKLFLDTLDVNKDGKVDVEDIKRLPQPVLKLGAT